MRNGLPVFHEHGFTFTTGGASWRLDLGPDSGSMTLQAEGYTLTFGVDRNGPTPGFLEAPHGGAMALQLTEDPRTDAMLHGRIWDGNGGHPFERAVHDLMRQASTTLLVNVVLLEGRDPGQRERACLALGYCTETEATSGIPTVTFLQSFLEAYRRTLPANLPPVELKAAAAAPGEGSAELDPLEREREALREDWSLQFRSLEWVAKAWETKETKSEIAKETKDEAHPAAPPRVPVEPTFLHVDMPRSRRLRPQTRLGKARSHVSLDLNGLVPELSIGSAHLARPYHSAKECLVGINGPGRAGSRLLLLDTTREGFFRRPLLASCDLGGDELVAAAWLAADRAVLASAQGSLRIVDLDPDTRALGLQDPLPMPMAGLHGLDGTPVLPHVVHGITDREYILLDVTAPHRVARRALPDVPTSVSCPGWNQSICPSLTLQKGALWILDLRGGATEPPIFVLNMPHPSFSHARFSDHGVAVGYDNGILAIFDLRYAARTVNEIRVPFPIGPIEYVATEESTRIVDNGYYVDPAGRARVAVAGPGGCVVFPIVNREAFGPTVGGTVPEWAMGQLDKEPKTPRWSQPAFMGLGDLVQLTGDGRITRTCLP